MGFLTDEELLGAARRRVFLDTDPGFPQMWHDLGLADVFAGHDAHVTIGERIGEPDCEIPTCGLDWITTPQPVVLDAWPRASAPPRRPFTSVASWRGAYGPVDYAGKRYGLRVHEFRRFARLPRADRPRVRAGARDPRAEAPDLALLRDTGWSLVDPADVATTPDGYRAFIAESTAELMIAKGMYVQSRSGWFSERSICYLASGRPVVAQDTGLGDLYPLGCGLLAFDTLDQAAACVESIACGYARHAAAARAIAEDRFDSDKVLARLLERLQPVARRSPRRRAGRPRSRRRLSWRRYDRAPERRDLRQLRLARPVRGSAPASRRSATTARARRSSARSRRRSRSTPERVVISSEWQRRCVLADFAQDVLRLAGGDAARLARDRPDRRALRRAVHERLVRHALLRLPGGRARRRDRPRAAADPPHVARRPQAVRGRGAGLRRARAGARPARADRAAPRAVVHALRARRRRARLPRGAAPAERAAERDARGRLRRAGGGVRRRRRDDRGRSRPPPRRRAPPLGARALPLRAGLQRARGGRAAAPDGARGRRSHDDDRRRRRAGEQAPPRRQRVGAHELGGGAALARLRRAVRRAAVGRRLRRRAPAAGPTSPRAPTPRRSARRRRRSASPATPRSSAPTTSGSSAWSATSCSTGSTRRRCSSTSAATCAGGRRWSGCRAASSSTSIPATRRSGTRPAATRPGSKATSCTSPSARTSARPRCDLPTGGIRWRPIRQPVVLDRWPLPAADERAASAASRPSRAGAARTGGRCGRGAATASRCTSSAATRRCPASTGLPFAAALDIHPADAHDADRLRAGGWRSARSGARRRRRGLPPLRARLGRRVLGRAGRLRRDAQRLVQRPHRPLPRERPSRAGAGHRLLRAPAGRRRASSPSARSRRRAPAPTRSSPTTPATAPPPAPLAEQCFAPAPALAPLLEAAGVAP